MKTYKLICKPCKKTLAVMPAYKDMKKMNEHAEKIASRHLNFNNDLCEERNDAENFLVAYDLIELTENEIKEIEYKQYMNGANL